MSWEKTRLTDRAGFEQGLRGYTTTFGGGIQSILKPFTTLLAAVGLPHYQKSIYTSGSVAPSSFVFNGADASGLNPFGLHTLGEGIIHGTGNISDLDSSIDPSYVRTFGLKTPMTYLGWGYDQFGYPTPNTNRSWEASGVFSTTGPSTSWSTSGFTPVTHGNQVPYSLWQAGPMDLRWDINRKIWTSPQSVYSARVLQAYSSGIIAGSGTAVYPSTITYDVIVNDGIANKVRVTGVYHVGPQPLRQSTNNGINVYKKYPLPSGAHVFLMHGDIGGKPGFVMYGWEEPGTLDCATTDIATSLFTAPVGNLSLSTLVADPLTTEYGGVGYNSYSPYDILVGHIYGSGDLLKLNLIAGTGITLVGTTGTLTIQLSSGVNFITASGVNSNITQLTGLTTPLSVAQGGTGSSVKNFLDLGTSQSASGYKTFTVGIRAASGSQSAPSIAYNNGTNFGIYFSTSPNGVGITASGNTAMLFSAESGNISYMGLHIDPSNLPVAASGNDNYGCLMIDGPANATYGGNPLQLWRTAGGITLGSFTGSGNMIAQSLVLRGSGITQTGSLIAIQTTSGFTGNTITASNHSGQQYFAINGSGTSLSMGIEGNRTTFLSPSGDRTINLASGYSGTVNVLASGISSVVTRQLSFINGLFVGYSDI